MLQDETFNLSEYEIEKFYEADHDDRAAMMQSLAWTLEDKMKDHVDNEVIRDCFPIVERLALFLAEIDE